MAKSKDLDTQRNERMRHDWVNHPLEWALIDDVNAEDGNAEGVAAEPSSADDVHLESGTTYKYSRK